MYKNFKTAFYLTTFDMELGLELIKAQFSKVEKYVHVDKVYIETYRSGIAIKAEEIEAYKAYFKQAGIKTSGGITLSKAGKNWFSSMCYSKDLDWVLEIAKTCAKYFDEIILDDFFFDNCRCSDCIEKKGDQTWETYRLDRHAQVSLKINQAIKSVNPDAKTIIKYPNWYESYSHLGYNLDESSRFFDGTYTGIETRETVYTQQNLQRFNSYFLAKYIDNTSHKNRGGWLDTLDLDLNIFLDQVYLSLLSACKEITLFSLGGLLTKDFVYLPLLGYALERMDGLLSELEEVEGFYAYKPYRSNDDYLLSLLGMLGITLDPHAKWLEKDHVFLSKGAAKDPMIIEKLKIMMKKPSRVIITSDFIDAIDFTNFADISLGPTVEVNMIAYDLESCSYKQYEAIEPLMIKKLNYHTNDIFEEVVALSNQNSYPLILKMFYDEGEIYILNIPNEPNELKKLPLSFLTRLRKVFSEVVQVEKDVSIIRYKKALVLYSYNQHNTTVDLGCEMVDFESQERLEKFILRPHEMKVLLKKEIKK